MRFPMEALLRWCGRGSGFFCLPPSAPAEPYGPELVTNGTFDDDTGWTVAGTGAGIADGVFHSPGGAGNKTAKRAPDAAIEEGATYHCTVTVLNRVSGFIAPRVVLNGVSTIVTEWLAADGTYTGDVVAPAPTDGTVGVLFSSSQVADLDNLSIKKVL